MSVIGHKRTFASLCAMTHQGGGMRWMTGSIAALAGILGVMAGAVAMPENNSSLAPLTTASVPVPAASQQMKYDAVYSMCGPMHSADQVPYNIGRDNGVSPMDPLYPLMFSSGMTVAQIKAAPANIKVLKVPTHGDLVPSDATSFIYHANHGYLGSDQMVFEVETMGKKFKVIQTVVVHNSGNLDYPTPEAEKLFDEVCPDDKGSSLDIIELPTEGFASAEELAMLHSMLSFALGGVGGMSNGSLNIADLPNAAVGQTTGSNITRDTNASGYGWFIDNTPGQNEEWLPTSNPQRMGSQGGQRDALLTVRFEEAVVSLMG